MTFLRKNKIRVLVFFLGAAFFFEKGVGAAQTEGSVTTQPGSYYDSGILGSGSHSRKGTKKSSKRRRHKVKRGDATIIQNPGESQEDVTDQKEVSDQADQPQKTGKRK